MQWKICIKYAKICKNMHLNICSNMHYMLANNMQIYAIYMQVYALNVDICYGKYMQKYEV